MVHFIDPDRKTSYLLPPSMEDWLPEGCQSALVIGQFSAGISVKIVHPRPDQYSGNSYSPSAS